MDSLRHAVNEASARPEVAEAVAVLYSDVQREIDVRRPLCVVSGRCCRFEEYGHRLFVTTIELAAFVAGLKRSRPNDRRQLPQVWNGAGCPFQDGKLCGVHPIRPFGCRMFFCDATSTQWQNELYERFHERIKRLHGELDVAYFYVEWRQALRAVLEAD